MVVFEIIGAITVGAVAGFAVLLLIYAIQSHIEWHDYVESTLDWLVKKAKEDDKRSEE